MGCKVWRRQGLYPHVRYRSGRKKAGRLVIPSFVRRDSSSYPCTSGAKPRHTKVRQARLLVISLYVRSYASSYPGTSGSRPRPEASLQLRRTHLGRPVFCCTDLLNGGTGILCATGTYLEPPNTPCEIRPCRVSRPHTMLT